MKGPIVRFAPSPTGYLHIGGARTALFNWLFAKHHKGQFLLRIEDTDQERSTPQAVQAILDSLNWLGLHHDGEVIFQSKRFARHAEVAHEMVEKGLAYYCYCSVQEVDAMREEAKTKGLPPKYNGFWRDRDQSLAPKDVKPVVRFKAPQDGQTVIQDLVQGDVVMQNKQADDLVLLRSDGTPTYMLSVIVDDHDMEITHIIRGDDHLTNAFRQKQMYDALGWKAPEFAHIPLIHGPDGAKLSKRHGALGAEQYKEMGYLPQTLLNYLLRLGWAHGDEEIISIDKAIEWFDLPAVGRSPSRMDFMKLNHVNAHYIRHFEDQVQLTNLTVPFIEKRIERSLTPVECERITKGMKGLQERAKTMLELAEGCEVYCDLPLDFDEKALKFCTPQSQDIIKALLLDLEPIDFTHDNLEETIRGFAEKNEMKLGVVSQALRVAITKRTISPSLFELMAILPKGDVIKRLQTFLVLDFTSIY